MNNESLKKLIKHQLSELNNSVERLLVKELSVLFDLGHSGVLQFEIDPYDFRISLIQTENDILNEFSLSYEISLEAEENELDANEVIRELIIIWLSEIWIKIQGPSYFSPAYIFYHGGLDSPRFNLETRNWNTVEEIWPELKN